MLAHYKFIQPVKDAQPSKAARQPKLIHRLHDLLRGCDAWSAAAIEYGMTSRLPRMRCSGNWWNNAVLEPFISDLKSEQIKKRI